MNLNKNYNYIKLDTLDLVRDYRYDRETGREFYQEFSVDSARDSDGEKRPSRISEWCCGVFNV